MNLFFLLISFCYHDRDSFAGVIWGDDDEYYLNDDNYNFYTDDDYGSGDDDFFQVRNVENLRRNLFTNYDKYNQGLPFIQKIDSMFKKLIPHSYQLQLDYLLSF